MKLQRLRVNAENFGIWDKEAVRIDTSSLMATGREEVITEVVLFLEKQALMDRNGFDKEEMREVLYALFPMNTERDADVVWDLFLKDGELTFIENNTSITSVSVVTIEESEECNGI